MNILYGVVGEGMGHAIRSCVVVDQLLASGHEVSIIASSKAAELLAERFATVRCIHGMHIITEEDQVRKGQTFWSNVLKGAAAIPDQIRTYFDLVSAFRPQVVISDFESWTYLFAKLHRLPIMSVDNMQMINRCTHGPEVLRGDRVDFEITRAFVKSKLPFCDHYLITSFFRPPIRRKNTSLYPPILRKEILDAKVEVGEHVVVYESVRDDAGLTDVLRELNCECRIYGMKQGGGQQVQGNRIFRPFSQQQFVEDLRTAKAVVASAGFTLMGECIYLKKPLLAVPIKGHFEQRLNGRYLALAGYGATSQRVDRNTLTAFLQQVPKYRQALSKVTHDRNLSLFEAIDMHLDRVEAGIY